MRFTAKAVGYCDVMSLAVDKLAEHVNLDEVFRERHAAGAERSHNPKGGNARQKLVRNLCGSRLKRSNTAARFGGFGAPAVPSAETTLSSGLSRFVNSTISNGGGFGVRRGRLAVVSATGSMSMRWVGELSRIGRGRWAC